MLSIDDIELHLRLSLSSLAFAVSLIYFHYADSCRYA
jgi:hypothetical protein